jgi:hypothetical protein
MCVDAAELERHAKLVGLCRIRPAIRPETTAPLTRETTWEIRFCRDLSVEPAGLLISADLRRFLALSKRFPD